MELFHLRYFVAVAEARQIGRAAGRLNLAQPALSRRMQDLERELGVTLLVRHRSGVDLTEAGALLLEHARGVLDRADAAREAMRAVRPGTTGALRVGVPPDTAPAVLCDLVTGFEDEVPGVVLRTQELTTADQVAALRRGRLDAAVVRLPAGDDELEHGPVLRRDIGVVGRAGDLDPPVRLADLAGRGLVVFPREMAPELYDDVLATCRLGGFSPTRIAHARNPGFSAGLVLAGRGVHLTDDPGDRLEPGLAWTPLADGSLAWRTCVAWREQGATRPVRALGAVVRRVYAAHGHHEEPTT